MFQYGHELKDTINKATDKNSETSSQKQPTFPYACYLNGWWLWRVNGDHKGNCCFPGETEVTCGLKTRFG